MKEALEFGKLDDFVVWSGDPTAIDREDVDTLDIMAANKEDKVICDAIVAEGET